MKQAFIIDVDGFMIEPVIVEDNFMQTDSVITVPYIDGLYKPKWNGNSWVEGLSQEEINNLQPIEKPTELELLKQQLEEEQKSNATINDTLMQFMDFYFSQNPEQA